MENVFNIYTDGACNNLAFGWFNNKIKKQEDERN